MRTKPHNTHTQIARMHFASGYVVESRRATQYWLYADKCILVKYDVRHTHDRQNWRRQRLLASKMHPCEHQRKPQNRTYAVLGWRPMRPRMLRKAQWRKPSTSSSRKNWATYLSMGVLCKKAVWTQPVTIYACYAHNQWGQLVNAGCTKKSKLSVCCSKNRSCQRLLDRIYIWFSGWPIAQLWIDSNVVRRGAAYLYEKNAKELEMWCVCYIAWWIASSLGAGVVC